MRILEQDREFRSEDLQEKNNEWEARKRQHNQLIIQNQQRQAQQSHSIQALLATIADPDLGFRTAKTEVVYFK